MASSFDEAIKTVLANEGGYVNDPADPGGETSFGISKAKYPEIDIGSLTENGAKAIYRSDYWSDVWEQIGDQRVATKLLDLAVNMGPGRRENKGEPRAVRLLQMALGDIGALTLMDGAFGEKTLAAVNGADADRLLYAFGNRAARHYFGICQGRPQSRKFLYAWIKRAFDQTVQTPAQPG